MIRVMNGSTEAIPSVCVKAVMIIARSRVANCNFSLVVRIFNSLLIKPNICFTSLTLGYALGNSERFIYAHSEASLLSAGVENIRPAIYPTFMLFLLLMIINRLNRIITKTAVNIPININTGTEIFKLINKTADEANIMFTA